MYDGYLFCEECEDEDLRNKFADIIDSKNAVTDIFKFAARIQDLYDDGELSVAQYDDLMRYVDECI